MVVEGQLDFAQFLFNGIPEDALAKIRNEKNPEFVAGCSREIVADWTESNDRSIIAQCLLSIMVLFVRQRKESG